MRLLGTALVIVLTVLFLPFTLAFITIPELVGAMFYVSRPCYGHSYRVRRGRPDLGCPCGYQKVV